MTTWPEVKQKYDLRDEGGSLHVMEWRTDKFAILMPMGTECFVIEWIDDPTHEEVAFGNGPADLDKVLTELRDREPPAHVTAAQFRGDPTLQEDLEAAVYGKEPLIGGYVNHSSYKLMRVRILLCGTAGPTEQQWSAGLSRLLDHLQKFPLPEISSDKERGQTNGPNLSVSEES